MVDVSIIICTHNRAAHLEKCLRALEPAARRAARAEVLVVANACTDNTAALVRQWPSTADAPVRLLIEPPPGLSRARNAGAAMAQGRTLIYLDDDALATPSWLAAYAAYFKAHPDVAAGGGPIEPNWGTTPRPPYWLPEFEVNVGRLELEPGAKFFPRGRWPFGGNMFVQAAAWRSVGPFRSDLGMQGKRLGLGEETDWFQRYVRTGGHLGYVPEARVTHWVNPANTTLQSLRHRAYQSGLASAQVHSAESETRGWWSWARHILGGIRRGKLPLNEQLYLLQWLGRLRGQQRRRA